MNFRQLAKRLAKRYNVGELIGSAIAILVLGMILAVGSIFIAQMKTTVTDANATSILDKVLVAFSTYADWINPLAFITVASVVILILIGIYLRLRGAMAITE